MLPLEPLPKQLSQRAEETEGVEGDKERGMKINVGRGKAKDFENKATNKEKFLVLLNSVLEKQLSYWTVIIILSNLSNQND